MITLALDEFGDFEGLKNDDKPIGIAGILYDDAGDRTDLRNERKRIEKFYRECISSVADRIGQASDLTYPSALHSNNSRERDARIVKPVKRKINDAIREFLRKGTYAGGELLGDSNKRKGKYYVFAIVKSDRGMTSLMGDSANFLVKDDQGSNLYFHMASEVVSRMLFHNPLIPNIKEISMNIASRRSDDMDKNSQEALEYYRQGYVSQDSTNPSHAGQVYFGIANADIYRSALSQEIIRAGKAQIKVEDFFVKSIRYTANAKNMELLYLADSICTFLSNGIDGNTDAEKLTKIINKSNQLNDKTYNLIFGYDEIDTMYQQAWDCYEAGNYFDSLKLCYDSRLKEGGYSTYYSKWFDYIRGLIMNNSDEGNFTRAVRSLHDTIKTNTLDQDRTVYILETLEKMAPAVSDKLDDTESKAIMYTLYDIGVSAYCHIGDSKRAISYYNKCKKYASRVGVEEYLQTLNKMSETLLDNFEWKKAKQVADDSVKYQEELLKMKNALPVYAKDDHMTSLGLSKAYSQKGQVYAFVRDEKAVEFFRRAMNDFSEESADYRITQSYLLHFYLDMGCEEAYREESRKYFGGEDNLRKQLDYILKEGFQESPIFNFKYALYVFIRGIYCFRLGELSDALRTKLYDIDSIISKAEIKVKGKRKATFSKLAGHPSEIIFKYLSLIAISNGDTDKADEFADRIYNCMGYTGATIDLIRMYGDVELLSARNDSAVEDKIEEVFSYMVENFEAFKNMEDSVEEDAHRSFVEKYLSYMYH